MVCEAGRVVNVARVDCGRVNAEGYREILGVDVTTAEGGAGWLTFLRSLTARSLSGVKLISSDARIAEWPMPPAGIGDDELGG
jgi:putative transposase